MATDKVIYDEEFERRATIAPAASMPSSTAAGTMMRTLADRVTMVTGDRTEAVTAAFGLADAVNGLVEAVEAGDMAAARTLAAVVRG